MRLRAASRVGRRIPESGHDLHRGGTRPPQLLIMGFIDTLRSEGRAVEWILQSLAGDVLLEVAARTYREWRRSIAARTITDAEVVDLVRPPAWTAGFRTADGG